MGSKRNALRYLCNNEPILLRTAFDDGEAELLNISTSGCAITQPSCPVKVQEKILLILKVEGQEDIQIQARIIRIDEYGIGAEFTMIDEEQTAVLRQHYSALHRQQLLQSKETS